MDNAIWLFQALPKWYFSTVVHPLSAGPLSALPVLGVISLVVGLKLGLSGRDPRLLLFFIPFAFSQLFVATSGALRGQLPGASSGLPLFLFIVVQVVLVAYLIYGLAGARGAAGRAGSILAYVCPVCRFCRIDVVQQRMAMKYRPAYMCSLGHLNNGPFSAHPNWRRQVHFSELVIGWVALI
jgi:hypothetical protein